MEISLTLLNEFRQLFAGNLNAYGVHVYTETKKGEKEKGTNYTKIEPLIDKHYKEHLEGKTGLGIVPIKEGNVCNFTVIDIDEYKKDLNSYLEIIFENNIPSFPFRSKSGGLHLYTFFDKNINVKVAKGYTSKIKSILGLNNKIEIFPKQNILVPGQTGNWINLPYYNYEDTKQYLIGKDFKPLTLIEALKEINSNLQSEDSLSQFLENIPLNDAPPCLQSIYLSKETDFRNEYLFSLAGYFKSKYGDDFEFKITGANNSLKKPLPIEELNKSIISSHKRKDYTYKCNTSPLIDLCDKEICSYRQFGIGGEEINQLSYQDFIQWATDPPYYEWVINDKSLKFYSEADIIYQQKFRMLCFRELYILPNRLKDIKWTKIINNALKNVIVKNISAEEDISPGALFKEYLIEFLEKRSMAMNKEQILVDRVFKDPKIKGYVFKAKNFINFLLMTKKFYHYGFTEIQDKFRILKGFPKRYYISKEHGTARVWILPFSSLKLFLDQGIDKKEQDIEINFEEDIKNEPF